MQSQISAAPVAAARGGGAARRDVLEAVLVVIVLAVALLAGWAVKNAVTQRTVVFHSSDAGLDLSYPATWAIAGPAKGTLLEVYDPRSGATFAPRFRVESRTAPQNGSLAQAAALTALARSQTLREYRELSSVQATVVGQRAVQVTYAYVADPPAGSGRAVLPIVATAVDTLVVKGDRLLVFTALSEAAQADLNRPVFERILQSVRFK